MQIDLCSFEKNKSLKYKLLIEREAYKKRREIHFIYNYL